MLHLGEVLIRKAIIFNKKIKNPAYNIKNEIFSPKNIGFILKPVNIQLSITINHKEVILKKGELKIKKAIWSKTDYEYYFLEIISTIFSFFSGK